jgi:hypothetical protein
VLGRGTVLLPRARRDGPDQGARGAAAAYITGVGVFTVGVAYGSLGLWFSATVQLASSALWFYFGGTKGTKGTK